MKTFTCKDVGVNCDQKFSGQTEQDILVQIEPHAREAHGIDQIDDKLRERIQGAIKEDEDKRIAAA